MHRTLLTILLLLAMASTVLGQQETPANPDAGQEVTYPGLSEVVPAKTRLLEEASSRLAEIESGADTQTIRETIADLTERQTDLLAKVGELGDPQDWPIERLLDTRQQLDEQRLGLEKSLEEISAEAASLDTLRQDWLDKQTYWSDWQDKLAGQVTTATRNAFDEAGKTIQGMLASLDRRQALNVALQQEISALLEAANDVSRTIDLNLESLRRDVFKKSAPALFSGRYWRQYNRELLNTLRQGLSNSSLNRPGFYPQHATVILVQLLVFATILVLVRLYSRDAVAPEWQFLASHPVATALFVTFVASGLFYQQPPSLINLVLKTVTIVSAAFLLKGLLHQINARRPLYVLIGVVVGRRLLEALYVPITLQRLYMLGATLFLTFLLLRTARDEGRRDASTPLLPTTLYLAAALFCAAAVAQLTGYTTLAFWVSDIVTNTTFTLLLLLMTLHLLRGAIDFIIASDTLQNIRFFSKHGSSLAQRLKLLTLIGVLIEGGLYLSVVWGVFDSPGEARAIIAAYGFTIGDTDLQIGMFVWAGLVMLLTFQLSWLVRSLLDVSVLRSRRYDRGVRDAVRKLVHYSLLTIGVLVALTTAGVDPRVFALLGGAFGIGIGFGLQNIVNNFVSGIILLFERPIKAGDTIVIENEWGTVKRIGLRSTVVETLDNSEIIVPNSLLISEKVTNWTLSTAMARIVHPVGVAYGSDIGKVLEILHDAADAHPLSLEDPGPSAIFTGFGDSSLNFELRVWIADIKERLRVKSEIFQAIEKGLGKAGIEIPFPQRDLHVRSIEADLIKRLSPDKAAAPKSRTKKGGA